MTDQKARWAAKAAKYREWADKAEAQAVALNADREYYRGDVAFWTQPGRLIARERMHAKSIRAYEMSQKAKKFCERATNLERMATTNSGDAAARYEAERVEIRSALKVGDFVDCAYGVCEVAKINTKTLKLKGRFGFVNHDMHLCRKVEKAA